MIAGLAFVAFLNTAVACGNGGESVAVDALPTGTTTLPTSTPPGPDIATRPGPAPIPSPTEPLVAPPPDTEGEFLFFNRGCGSCHSTGDDRIIGPGLSGLSDRAGGQVTGMNSVEYIEQSIRFPNVFIVPGFLPDLMPTTFAQSMTEDEIAEVVAFLLTLP